MGALRPSERDEAVRLLLLDDEMRISGDGEEFDLLGNKKSFSMMKNWGHAHTISLDTVDTLAAFDSFRNDEMCF